MANDTTIIIAAHKEYRMPKDMIYLPLQVGAEEKNELGYARDNTGDNISSKNPSFCELTGLYWAWKNLKSDYIGLVHYRRYFSYSKKSKDSFDNILTSNEINDIHKKYSIILPKKRNYYIETLYSHYAHTHYAEHLDETRKIISKKYPDYITSYDKAVNSKSGYMFNMMVLPKNLLNDYCIWLFDILFELENRIDQPGLSQFQGRFYGRVSEIIFNVWLDYQINAKNISKSDIKELNCIYMEPIDWSRKIASFAKAKFLHKKYERSF